MMIGVAAVHAENGSREERAAVQALEHVTIFVRDYDEALAWYVDRLGFVKVEDRRFGPSRWVTIAPSNAPGTHIVLAVPNEALRSSIGHQHNWVFRTADCHGTYQRLNAKGVRYVQQPQEVPWGCQAIIEDLYGNRIVLLDHGAQDAGWESARKDVR
jgi:catechol 2,3-dioxygenase-like lactoylglutathione lyase family enzyme